MSTVQRVGLVLAPTLTLTLILGCEHSVAVPEPQAEQTEQAEIAEPAAPNFRSERVQQGYASWYSSRLAGHRTADGELYDPRRMTAAHRTLPFGTWVEVTCLETGRRVRVRITDRGPFGHADRVIDLSRAAADQLGIRARGLALVALHVVAGP